MDNSLSLLPAQYKYRIKPDFIDSSTKRAYYYNKNGAQTQNAAGSVLIWDIPCGNGMSNDMYDQMRSYLRFSIYNTSGVAVKLNGCGYSVFNQLDVEQTNNIERKQKLNLVWEIFSTLYYSANDRLIAGTMMGYEDSYTNVFTGDKGNHRCKISHMLLLFL